LLPLREPGGARDPPAAEPEGPPAGAQRDRAVLDPRVKLDLEMAALPQPLDDDAAHWLEPHDAAQAPRPRGEVEGPQPGHRRAAVRERGHAILQLERDVGAGVGE